MMKFINTLLRNKYKFPSDFELTPIFKCIFIVNGENQSQLAKIMQII